MYAVESTTNEREHTVLTNNIFHKLARDAGDLTYNTNTPCRRGHTSPRYTASGACVACQQQYSRTRSERPSAGLRAIACIAGDLTYTTNTLCNNGHVSSRYTSNGRCVTCQQVLNRKRARHTSTGKRADARLKDQVSYSTGKPCQRGHVSPRYTASGACVACVAVYAQARNTPDARVTLRVRLAREHVDTVREFVEKINKNNSCV